MSDAATYQALILAELGDTPSNSLATNIAALWALGSNLSDQDNYYATKRKAILWLMGWARTQVDIQAVDGTKVAASQYLANLQALLDANTAEQQANESQGDVAGGVIGTITKTAPIMPPSPSWLDANSRGWRGDPYRRQGEPNE